MTGRPSIYTEELVNEICETIAHSNRGLAYHCSKNEHWPNPSTIYDWLDDPKKAEFSKRYARAKDTQIEFLMDEILEISDDTSQDTISFTKPNGEEVEMENKEWVNRSKLKVDTRKWIAAHLKPKKYGDKLDITSDNKPIQRTIVKWGDKTLEI